MKRCFLVLLAAIITVAAKAQQWEINYGDASSYTALSHGIVNDKGEAVFVGSSGTDKHHYYPIIMSVTVDGDFNSRVFDTLEGNLGPSHILQLNNGNYFVTAVKSLDYSTLTGENVMFLVLDPDFNMVDVKSYELPEMVLGMAHGSLMLDDDGTIIYSGGYLYQDVYGRRSKPCFYRFDENGDLLSSRFVTASYPHPEANIHLYECFQLLKNPVAEGFVTLCTGLNNMCSLLKYDYDFNYVDGFVLEPLLWDYFQNAYSDLWLSDNHLMVMGYMNSHDENANWDIGLAEVDLDGTFGRWERVYYKQDTTIQAPTQCMAYVNDTTIYGAAFMYKNLGGTNYAAALLFDKDMEVLGKKEFFDAEHRNQGSLSVLPLPDGSCLINTEEFTLGDYSFGKFIKMHREDFNPIPCRVKEVPKETITALAFPNPAKDELNIDISGLSEGRQHRIRITDALGHICMSRIIRGDGNLLTVGVSSLKPGVYVYSIYNSEKEVLRNKFIKE